MIKIVNILKELDYSLHVNRHNEFDVDKYEKSDYDNLKEDLEY